MNAPVFQVGDLVSSAGGALRGVVIDVTPPRPGPATRCRVRFIDRIVWLTFRELELVTPVQELLADG